MPTIKYALEKGQPKRLGISWEGKWQNIKVSLDGEEIGTFRDEEHLRAGQEFPHEDNSRLKVQLTGGSIWCPIIQIFKDGEPLPSAGPSPAKRLRMTCQFLFLIAAANLMIGAMGLSPNVNVQYLPTGGWLSIVAGLIFGVLGLFVMRKSKPALLVAVLIFSINAILSLVFRRDLGLMLWVGLVIRLLVLLSLLQGFGAIDALKQEQSSQVENETIGIR